ncbi:MAG: HAMP domain-containing sensor histidine kinase [Paludibacter sp.]|nr:HAMP domain-containing sensor histidine kinase [Paludibacter sp.]
MQKRSLFLNTFRIWFITFFSVICILLILGSQAYIIYDNYKLTRKSLIRESDAILETAFRKDLSIRHKTFKHLRKEDDIIAPPPQTAKNTIKVDMSKYNDLGNNTLGTIDLAINYVVGTLVPLNLNRLDSITGTILKARGINSTYTVNIIDPISNKVLAESKKGMKGSVFVIHSKILLIDFQRNKSLQLLLINPFTSIFKRMGILLITSFLLSLFCFYALWFLFRTLARQKKLIEIKNEFFGHTAHELKRPVAHLHMALEALSNPAIDENKLKKERYLAISKDATRDMSEKITMIMTLSMAEEGVFNLNYSEFDINSVITDLREKFMALSDKKIAIQFENQDEKVIVRADRDHISQTIANLIDNAIRYSKESVQILITTQKIKKTLVLLVKDNGIGIKPEKINQVFEKYVRLNPEAGSPAGFGIGLSYVKAVVDKHSGRIELKSEVSIGSEFILYLPV